MECFSPITRCVGTLPQTVLVTHRKTLWSPGFWKYSQLRTPHASRESQIFSTQTKRSKRSDFDLFLEFFDSQPLSNHQIGILLLRFDNTTFIYHLRATSTKLHSLDTPTSDKKYRYVGALRQFLIFCCFFWIFQNDHFRAFFTIFLQLITANSVNRCSPASFPYINDNPSSRDYICQVIASGCT